MGVFLQTELQERRGKSLPHARGGVSLNAFFRYDGSGSSPRTWGCFCRQKTFSYDSSVFPTHVGVFLNSGLTRMVWTSLPHARGGVSNREPLTLLFRQSSPRTWGCFRPSTAPAPFSESSPRTWGCFLAVRLGAATDFSLPHARGGVSLAYTECSSGLSSSPRTWGCFCCGQTERRTRFVFPTHVGVFLKHNTITKRKACLPHARGGVSICGMSLISVWGSSPRTWGCFHFMKSHSTRQRVFPTHVGVFPFLWRMTYGI